MQIENFPFSAEMARACIEGRKCATTRSEPKGEQGDWFYIKDVDKNRDVTFKLIDIIPLPLGQVADILYRLEGTESPEAFIALWKSLHRGHYVPYKEYHVHFIQRICPQSTQWDVPSATRPLEYSV
jgi:hypothetical protein